jgi:hypothetical protein
VLWTITDTSDGGRGPVLEGFGYVEQLLVYLIEQRTEIVDLEALACPKMKRTKLLLLRLFGTWDRSSSEKQWRIIVKALVAKDSCSDTKLGTKKLREDL